MSELKAIAKLHFRERYRKWLETRDAKYLNQNGLTEQEAEKIKEEVYREKYRQRTR